MKYLVYALPGNDDFADLIARRGRWERRALTVHCFPDEEVLVTVDEPDRDAPALLVCTLDHPNPKVVPLLMAAATLRGLGAQHIILVAPYLAYMRQDKRFHKGEAVSSEVFGQLLARYVDGLVTIDPHLHRHARLQDIGLDNGVVAPAAPAVAAWIRSHIPRPLIVGPDEESRPWVAQVGQLTEAPTLMARKTRHDDTHVSITFPTIDETWLQRTPVVLDDVISSGHTMGDCVVQLAALGLPPAICIAVHDVSAPEIRQRMRDAGASRFVSTNSIAGRHAEIDVSGCVVNAILAMDVSPVSLSHHTD